MAMKDFRDEIDSEISTIVASDFTIEITETQVVPSIDDPAITYPNLTDKVQKCKLIETCVMYIDIRQSTTISLSHRRETLAKLYSSFVRSMVKAAEYFGGRVRNIIGDRVMVVFDTVNCYKNAVNTAILMNSIAQYILNKHFTYDEIRCGIGIDFGKMLVTKTGIIKQGVENSSYKSLVWLGKPANIASKLTDVANKATAHSTPYVRETHYYPALVESGEYDFTPLSFLARLRNTDSPNIRHEGDYFRRFDVVTKESTTSTRPILITEAVYNGFKKDAPDDKSLTEKWWSEEVVSVPGYSGKIFGTGTIFTDFTT